MERIELRLTAIAFVNKIKRFIAPKEFIEGMSTASRLYPKDGEETLYIGKLLFGNNWETMNGFITKQKEIEKILLSDTPEQLKIMYLDLSVEANYDDYMAMVKGLNK